MYTNQTGAFPITSNKGKKYIMILGVVDCYVNVLVFFERDGECFSIVQLVGQWLFLLSC